MANLAQQLDTNLKNILTPPSSVPPITNTTSGTDKSLGVLAPVSTATSNFTNNFSSPINTQSTTTLSSNKTKDILNANNNLTTYGDKGTRTDTATGATTLANGSVAPEPEKLDANGLLINPPGAIYDRNTGNFIQPEDTSNTDLTIKPPEDTGLAEYNSEIQNLNNLQSQVDSTTADLIENIKQKFAQRKSEQADVNMRQNKGVMNALLMGGVTGQGSSAQYAPISSEGIIGLQESFGIKQLGALDAQENDLIAQAKAAQLSGNFRVMEAKNALIEKKRQEKIDVATKLNEDIAKANEEARKNAIQASRDSSVADLIAQGITDPGKILNYLNYNEKGQQVGDFTAKEIKDTLANIATTNNTDLKGLSADVQEFYRLKAEPGGLPVSILHLPDTASQIAAYLKLKLDAKKTGITTPGIINTPNGPQVTPAGTKALQIILGSGKFTKDQKASIIDAVNNGEDPFTVIKNQAKNIMTSANATKLEAAETARNAFDSLAQSIQDFYNAGGKTSLVSGNLSRLYSKFGSVTDPALVELATQIQGNIQTYRNAISGTAYSEQEGKDIASIFPGIDKSETLNTAITNGRRKLFDSTIDAAYKGTLGEVYDELKKAETNVLGGSTPDDFLNNPLPTDTTATGVYNPSVWATAD